jgi:hypothetical protein
MTHNQVIHYRTKGSMRTACGIRPPLPSTATNKVVFVTCERCLNYIRRLN